ncbi:hypothetical protein BDN71DRAFT_1262583 [Pleurotus eryngii]|uniref:F-box domain-containing protein n=1 Tax=Pleurotus eryngii TaxID=5323 RepID=A0A9P6DCT5_PLEER|nr:hypothetical protein BDN71DRAFT_1262583 [Pleurotus eryngii]
MPPSVLGHNPTSCPMVHKFHSMAPYPQCPLELAFANSQANVLLSPLHEVRFPIDRICLHITSTAHHSSVTAHPPPRGYGTRKQVAPVFRLPAETFRLIFAHFAATDKDMWEGCIQVPLSQVCRSWRTIALDMPIVWYSILARLPRDKSLNRVAAYFGRSQSSRITLNISGDWEQATVTPQSPILQHLRRLIRNHHSQPGGSGYLSSHLHTPRPR